MAPPRLKPLSHLFYWLRNRMSPQNPTSEAERMDLEAWRQATAIVMFLAALVFLVQRLFGPIFDVVFEIFVFYVPAVTIVALYLHFRTKLTDKS
jgi:hypothetical protein